MTCNGCRKHVEETLAKVEGVTMVSVNLEKAEATIEMESHIPIEKFQESLKADGGRYSIHEVGDINMAKRRKRRFPTGMVPVRFIARCIVKAIRLMTDPGDCPVCGMDLVEEQNLSTNASTQYTCPMHPEIIRDQPGSCPICGMDLVPMQPDLSAEEKTYKKLLKKLWIAAVVYLADFLDSHVAKCCRTIHSTI